MKYVFMLTGTVVIVFVAVLLINALKTKLKARKLAEEIVHRTEDEQRAYAEKLGKMIRCETVSTTEGYDDTEFSKLRETMKELFPLVHEKCEKMTFSDDCWIYKLKGRDESRNVMVMSHHDVAAVKGEWEHPGFCGEIFGDALWGRGTIDTKTPLFAEFQALEELLKEGFVPECNLYIGSSHNEGIAGDGIPRALEYFKERGITFETVLDEGGAIIDPPLAGMKCQCAMMAVHEKGVHRLECSTREGNTHTGLAANVNTPVARMSAFITEINTKNIFIRRLYPEVKAMFEDLCPYTPFFMTVLFSNLWCFGGLLKWAMPKINQQAGAMIGTSCSFNEISGSRDDKKCTAKAVLRCVNDGDLKKDIEAVKKVAQKYGVEVGDGENNEYHKPADMTKPAFSYTKDCIARCFPNVAAAAYVLPAGTDSRHLTDICDCVIRFAPIAMNSQQFASVHSENENISLKAIGNAVEFYKIYMKNYK